MQNHVQVDTVEEVYRKKYSRVEQVKFVEESLKKILKAVFHKFYFVDS